MNKDLYSNTEFTELKKRINTEIIRRGGFKWYDPLSTPKVGEDRTPPLSIPDIGKRVPVDDKTYTINNPSEGSIERTRNIQYPAVGENPAGQNPTFDGNEPSTSAAALSADELRNFIVGVSKIRDINLFYGRDEKAGTAFRDPQDIEDIITSAEQDILSEKHKATFKFFRDGDDLILETYIDSDVQGYIDDNGNLIVTYSNEEDHFESFSFEEDNNGDLIVRDKYGIMCFRMDYNNGEKYPNPDYPVDDPPIQEFPIEDGYYMMPSGERDGEEVETYRGLGPHNFFDDYGAKPGDAHYHPYNHATTPQTRRDYYIHDRDRNGTKVIVVQGGIKASTYGENPRNPNPGNEYKSVPIFQGKPGTCNNACTGLCYQTCDSQCSESCNVTCTVRCGNSCTSTCGNVCTGCSSMCYSSCTTKCENTTGYACVKSGSKTVKIYTAGGHDGTPAQNHMDVETYACQGCSYSCQFYPNKKTECWDAGCMGKCFTSCTTACSTSCLGGCINNDASGSKGQGCSAGCTMNCSGICEGTCEGMCTQTCFNQCKELCRDNCFKAGTLIETINGPVAIEQLNVGDKVLTQSGSYHIITRIHDRMANSDETTQISVNGAPTIFTTKEHPFWTKKYQGRKRISKTNCIQSYNEPTWIEAGNLSNKDRLCFLTFKFGDVHIEPGIAYMVGRWLGDGWRFDEVNPYTKTITSRFGICCGHQDEEEFDAKIMKYGFKFTKQFQETIYRYDILRRENSELISLLKKCGKGAKNKFIPNDFFTWDESSLRNLVQGYIDSDGHIDKRGYLRVNSVSKKLIYGFANIFRMFGKNPSWGIRIYDDTIDHFIQGRKVNMTTSYSLQVNYYRDRYNSSGHYDDIDGHIWGTIHNQKSREISYRVYNISVDGDHSYYADGILVHNCEWTCDTICGAGCDNGCTNGCTGCDDTCDAYCTGQNDMNGCTGCGTRGGCTSTCQFDCNQNCIGKGCRSLCGIDSAGACSNNCRISCSGASCTSQCSDQCTDMCTACINTCGWGCGYCSSLCSTGCESECNITCTATCEHSCETNCVQSCTEECSGCSNLCYSCVGMCIGICSLTCDGGCSSCSKQCGWWCDVQCNQACFSNCDDTCLSSCSNSCTTLSGTDSTLSGPERGPTSQGYPIPHPSNRIEEMQSFVIDMSTFSEINFTMYSTDDWEGIIDYLIDPRILPDIYIDENGDAILNNNGTIDDAELSRLRFESVDGNRIAIIGDYYTI